MTGDFQLEMNEYLPLRDVVFQTLRQAILKGELKPGERLMEIQLAQKLGVSRTPVREAIRKLELEGLVLMIPRKGAEVAEITIKDLEDVLEVRAALEELAVCDACENITEEQILALKEAADNFRVALESDDLVKCAETDMAFHEVIYSATNNKRLLQILNNLREQMYRYRVEYVPVLAMLGAGLGWDAYYFYNFSTPATKIAGLSPLIFSGAPLPIPENSTFRGYTAGFRSASDEIVMATLAVTAQAHINGIAPNREKIDVTYGKGAILDLRYRNYSPNPVSKEPIFTELVGGGVMEYLMMPGMYRKLIHASIRTQLGVDFDPEQEAPIRVSGKDLDKIESDEHSVLKNSPDITWDPAAGTVVLDNRHSKILAGVLPKELTFADGVSFRPKKSMFAFFGLSSRDGKAIAESRELVFALTSESENTGYRLNPDKMERGPLALIPAIENRGTTPVIVTRPSGVIHVPGKPFTLKRFNFAGYCYRNETVGDGRITVEEGEPLFLGVITR